MITMRLNLKIFFVIVVLIIGGLFLLNNYLSAPDGCKRTKKVSRNLIKHTISPNEIIYYADVLDLSKSGKDRALTVTYGGVKGNKLVFQLDFTDSNDAFDLGKRTVLKEILINGNKTADLSIDGFVFGLWGYCNLTGCHDGFCAEKEYLLKVRLLEDGTNVTVEGLQLMPENSK